MKKACGCVLLIVLLVGAAGLWWFVGQARESGPTTTTEPGVGPAPAASVTTSGGEPAGRYAQLPNAHRYDCSKVVRAGVTIADLERGYDTDNWRARMITVLERRYPDAAWMVGTLQQPSLFDAWFVSGRGDWSAAMTELGTAVHESAHMAGLGKRRGRTHVLIVGKNDELRFPIVDTMHRSEIKSRLPAAVAELSYTSTYLEGKSGAQGFEMLLDELNAYTYSLYTAVALADQQASNTRISARDGLMVFLYYQQAYLRLAREKHPKSYQAIMETKPLRAATLLLNDRAECVLALSAPHDRIGIDDEAIWPHVFGEHALGELTALRKAQ